MVLWLHLSISLPAPYRLNSLWLQLS